MVVALIVGWFPNLFAPEMMWFGSAMTFVGGGNAVLIATIYGSLADILPESERYAVCVNAGGVRIHPSD